MNKEGKAKITYYPNIFKFWILVYVISIISITNIFLPLSFKPPRLNILILLIFLLS